MTLKSIHQLRGTVVLFETAKAKPISINVRDVKLEMLFVDQNW